MVVHRSLAGIRTPFHERNGHNPSGPGRGEQGKRSNNAGDGCRVQPRRREKRTCELHVWTPTHLPTMASKRCEVSFTDSTMPLLGFQIPSEIDPGSNRNRP